KASVDVRPVSREVRRKYLGGRGINMYLLNKAYTADLDPLSPDNPLIFGAGLLTGTLGFGSRVNISAKSPETGHLGDSNMGGEFGAALVRAGFSHLVVTGRSRRPVYVSIRDGEIEIRDARKLKGLDTVETQKKIRSDPGEERAQIACIGPAGENLVRYAAVRSGLKNDAGRTGMGTVMGSKNLKAVTATGTRDIRVFDPEGYQNYTLSLLK
ncbi:MAG: aldehyde ferredoxin oxidoreductase N-terminal domain-containing protein, partial [Pseudomonadota bacterium]